MESSSKILLYKSNNAHKVAVQIYVHEQRHGLKNAIISANIINSLFYAEKSIWKK